MSSFLPVCSSSFSAAARSRPSRARSAARRSRWTGPARSGPDRTVLSVGGRRRSRRSGSVSRSSAAQLGLERGSTRRLNRAGIRWRGLIPWSLTEPAELHHHACSAPIDVARPPGPVAGRIGRRPRRDHHRLAAGQRGPQRLGDERHERVQQPQQPVQHLAEHPPGGRRAGRRRPARPWPAPGTSRRPRPRRSGRAGRRPWRTRSRRRAVDLGDHPVQPGQDPARRRRSAAAGSSPSTVAPLSSANRVAFHSLVQKLREPGDPLLADRHVGARDWRRGRG